MRRSFAYIVSRRCDLADVVRGRGEQRCRDNGCFPYTAITAPGGDRLRTTVSWWRRDPLSLCRAARNDSSVGRVGVLTICTRGGTGPGEVRYMDPLPQCWANHPRQCGSSETSVPSGSASTATRITGTCRARSPGTSGGSRRPVPDRRGGQVRRDRLPDGAAAPAVTRQARTPSGSQLPRYLTSYSWIIRKSSCRS
jgi:hypothetical protein